MQTIPLVAYADRFSVRPGETISFNVSGISDQPYQARLVRVISADPNPEGPGIIEEDIDCDFAGSYPSREQAVNAGSVMTADAGALAGLESFTLIATIWPTTPEKGAQGVLTCRTADGENGIALSIDESGAFVHVGDARLSVGKALARRRWYRICASYDSGSGELAVSQTPLQPQFGLDDGGAARATTDVSGAPVLGNAIMVAAVAGTPTRDHFNGKIERPVILREAVNDGRIAAIAGGGGHDALVHAWDFSRDPGTPLAVDTGPGKSNGELRNLPTRAMTGSNWDGSCHSWSQKPEHYGAIHFHDDDIYDCGWDSDFSFAVPDDFKSGIYAARMTTADGYKEMVPFFVPAPKGKPRNKLCVLVSTLTYTVYANIARGNTDDALRDRIAEWSAFPHTTDDHIEYGLSTYNYHSDGSGIGYSSRLRPIITMRSAVISYPNVPGSGLRHFSADSHLWSWLEANGYNFDVITDDELHHEGVDAIAGYDAVTTASHPEYHTAETLDALQDYTQQGGRFMYLGGNGFYWKVAVNEHYPSAVEIRRGEGGIRAWAAEPGEYYNAFDGSYGGLWRRNGRPPQMLCGVGFTSQGGHIGDYYRRTQASHDPEHAWIFAGIDDEIIGDFGLSGGGAAGFELDRADKRLGTPANAVVLASSEGHGKHFVLVPEDMLTNLLTWNGETPEELIRSDIVYFDTANGGAVFSVGSITFVGSLPYNNGDNNVAKMIANVLDRFLAR